MQRLCNTILWTNYIAIYSFFCMITTLTRKSHPLKNLLIVAGFVRRQDMFILAWDWARRSRNRRRGNKIFSSLSDFNKFFYSLFKDWMQEGLVSKSIEQPPWLKIVPSLVAKFSGLYISYQFDHWVTGTKPLKVNFLVYQNISFEFGKK